MTSKTADLIAVTEAAQEALNMFLVLQHHFGEFQQPHTDADRARPTYYGPAHCLPYFGETYRWSRKCVDAFTEKIRWELAGLSSPRGIRVGASLWPSAHEAVAEVSRITVFNLNHLFLNNAFLNRFEATFDWNKGVRSIPEELQEEFNAQWEGSGYHTFRIFLWEMISTIRFLRVFHLRGILDCEHALARRGRRVSFRQDGFPRSTFTPKGAPSRSRVTGAVSFSPSTEPNVVRFLRAVQELEKRQPEGGRLQLSGIYAFANLKGASQTRAKDAAVSNGWIDDDYRLLPAGIHLLEQHRK